MASASAKKIRPKYLSLPALLFEIRMPVPAWVSVTHRISGALLLFPFAAWLLFMRGDIQRERQGAGLAVPADDASGKMTVAWDAAGTDQEALVRTVASDESLWGTDLTTIPGFAESAAEHLAAYLSAAGVECEPQLDAGGHLHGSLLGPVQPVPDFPAPGPAAVGRKRRARMRAGASAAWNAPRSNNTDMIG